VFNVLDGVLSLAGFQVNLIGRFWVTAEGIDHSGPHIYVVRNSDVSCQDPVGFAAIGAGHWHAESQFMFAGHVRLRPFPETLLLVYSAKKRAEVAPGVGAETDMFMIGPVIGSHTPIGHHVLQHLDGIYQDSRAQEIAIGNKARERAAEYVSQIIAESAPKGQASLPEDRERK
jgi:hypothetical protein